MVHGFQKVISEYNLGLSVDSIFELTNLDNYYLFDYKKYLEGRAKYIKYIQNDYRLFYDEVSLYLNI